MKQIFLDMDGVICDLDQGIINYFGWDITQAAITNWTFLVDKYKEENPGKTLKDFWYTFDFLFWATLKKTKEADVILNFVKQYKPIILTHAADSPGIHDGKASWLKRHVPEYFKDGRYLIGGTKHQLAGPDKLLIDDCENNCKAWFRHGGKALLVPRPWNIKRGMSVYNEIRYGLNIWNAEGGN